MKRPAFDTQPDLFVDFHSDLALRDQREVMERPFFSLSKKKRIKPIEYVSPDKEIFVKVSPVPEYGMATIWDADILIWATSVMRKLKDNKINDVPRTLRFYPYDLLKSIHGRRRVHESAPRALAAAINHDHHEYPCRAQQQAPPVQLDRELHRRYRS
jgi:plasmid replication initiation protein